MKKALFILAGLLVGGAVIAAPLTAARNTVAANGNQIYLDVYSNTVIYGGGMLAVNSSGYAVEAVNASGHVIVGRAESTVDNSSGTIAAKHVLGRSGVFYWDSADVATSNKSAIGQIAYVVDDHTVSITTAGSYSTIAGIVMDWDSVRNQVAVDTHDFAASAASTVGSLTVQNAATVGTTLSATGKITGGAGLAITGNSVVSGISTTATETVTGNATVGGTLGVTGIVSANSNLAIAVNETVGGTLGVTGVVSANSNLNVAVNETVGGTLGVTTGTTTLTNTTVLGTIGVAGVATLTSAPKLVVQPTPGAVVAAPLANLPTSSISNAVFVTVTVGTNNYSIPAYMQVP